ncbi:hypothetical protein NDU88_006287 [Pleurodeles waltl]|uniref:Uncharacterized protein n=1 Tax=Pleurodeles waltl TaxID=8319 RepID=A0AAV7NPW5_PLEWA|nr:hypothetical protein NDU88_006287 [Pleurodeles waltl]
MSKSRRLGRHFLSLEDATPRLPKTKALHAYVPRRHALSATPGTSLDVAGPRQRGANGLFTPRPRSRAQSLGPAVHKTLQMSTA